MCRSWVRPLVFAVVVSFSPFAAVAQDETTPGQKTWRAKLVEVMDAMGFEKPLVAFSILVPASWRSEGGVVWGQSAAACGGMGYNYRWQATSPDGHFGVAVVPTMNWRFNTTGTPSADGCPNMPITNVLEYLQVVVQRYRPGARVLDYRPRPDLAKSFEYLNAVTPMPLGELRNWVEGGEVLIAYPAGGVDRRETIAAVATFSVLRSQPMMDGMPGADYWSGGSFPGFAAYAPAGQLNFQFTEAIRKSVKPGSEWSRRIAQHHAKMSGIALKGTAERAAITRQYYNDMNQIRAESWKTWNETSDRMHRESSEVIRGVETYEDPYHGGTVELDNTYENAWQLNDGSYVLTNDPSFEPYRVYGQDGQRLRAAQ